MEKTPSIFFINFKHALPPPALSAISRVLQELWTSMKPWWNVFSALRRLWNRKELSTKSSRLPLTKRRPPMKTTWKKLFALNRPTLQQSWKSLPPSWNRYVYYIIHFLSLVCAVSCKFTRAFTHRFARLAPQIRQSTSESLMRMKTACEEEKERASAISSEAEKRAKVEVERALQTARQTVEDELEDRIKAVEELELKSKLDMIDLVRQAGRQAGERAFFSILYT